METFFMVWCPTRNPPTFRHDTHQSALTEAKRLASLNQGQQFFVLTAMQLVESNNVRVEQLDATIPF